MSSHRLLLQYARTIKTYHVGLVQSELHFQLIEM